MLLCAGALLLACSDPSESADPAPDAGPAVDEDAADEADAGLPQPWQLEQVSPISGEAHLSVAGDGTAILLTEEEGQLSWRLQAPGGTWSEQKVLATGLGFGSATLRPIDGGAVLVWDGDEALLGWRYAAAEWSGPVDLASSVEGNISSVRLGAAPGGAASLLVQKSVIDEGLFDRWSVDLLTLGPDLSPTATVEVARQVDGDEEVPGCEPGVFTDWNVFVDPAGARHVFAICYDHSTSESDQVLYHYPEAAGFAPAPVASGRTVESLDVAFDAAGEMHLTYVHHFEEPDSDYTWPHIFYRAGVAGEALQLTHGIPQSSAGSEIVTDPGGAIYIAHGTGFRAPERPGPSQLFAEVSVDGGATFATERISNPEHYSRRVTDLTIDPSTGTAKLVFQIPLDSDGSELPGSGWWLAERPAAVP